MTIWGGLPTQMDKTRGGAVRCGAVLWTSWSTAPRRHQKREWETRATCGNGPQLCCAVAVAGAVTRDGVP
eukprot:CAMPEP_0174337702 /NCGR_PEP_ID=MMETSP0810-20121108/22543_1 /TAXON_ID=73025 ORGANISM="Eutreptiella gymnastica-like, Strain CCMP1594" /NCGR_SAMPLE_ID=MMETSP0810 /ASSEMBLY_ACC=CAM_ASM_000659 /LENGTH=69 /DNA_ID=CAMNT_0015457337 /DNA_START=258 /DNA_END=463 /DNA_ORIENTATION=-